MGNKSKVRNAFLDAASKLFSQYGYEKTGIDQITRLSGRAKTSLYYHFDSKLAIFRACLEREFRALKDKLDETRAKFESDPADCLAKYLRARIELLPMLSVFKSYVSGLSVKLAGGELRETAEDVRADFDRYEYLYFKETAEKALSAGVFPETVSSDAFAEMLIVLLRGLEIQFFATESLENIRPTYEALIEMILQNYRAAHPKTE